jgi:hypothetical protein
MGNSDGVSKTRWFFYGGRSLKYDMEAPVFNPVDVPAVRLVRVSGL